MLRVLVLGGDGMLGQMVRNVLAASEGILLESTQRRDPAGLFHFDVEAGPEGLRALLKREGGFEYLINCIGILASRMDLRRVNSIRSALVVNALFPHDLAGLAAEAGARVIHASTDGVFAPNAGACFEDTTISCNDPYGQTKALGEVISPSVLNIRCSLIGPDPLGRRGLMEWLRGQPRGAQIPGYTDHLWNGVTTLQFALLCSKMVRSGSFDSVRAEGGTHHFCPNQPVSKYELLRLLGEALRPDVMVIPTNGPARADRLLDTRYHGLRRLFGSGIPMKDAVTELAISSESSNYTERQGYAETPGNHPGNTT